MKATQDNAVWVSNDYQQGSSEDNWAVAQATVRVPKAPLMIESATTTSATVHAPYGSPGTTEEYVLYNPTDGEVTHTVSLSNNVATTLGSDNFNIQGNSNQATNLDGVENACAGIFTADGDYAYFKSATGGFWYKIGLPAPFRISNSNNTLDSTFTLTTLASEDSIRDMGVSYAAGGNYIYLWGRGQVVARYTLTTPYLMETATDLQTYDLTSYLDTVFTSGKENSGFVGFKVSADGTKGMAAVKLWASTAGNGYISNYLQGFTLSTPFDLSTIKITTESNLLGYANATGYFANAVNFSESGDFVQGFAGEYNSANYYQGIYLNTPWDVSAGSSVTSEYINNFYSGSPIYNQQISTLFNPVDDHMYITSNGSHYYDTNSFINNKNPYPTATLTYTSAGLTAAPTVIFKQSSAPSAVSIAELTRADVEKNDLALSFSSADDNNDVLNRIQVYPTMDYQGSTAITTGTILSIDGTEFTLTGAPTFQDDDAQKTGSVTSKPEIGSSTYTNYKKKQLRDTVRYVGSSQVTSPTTYPTIGSTSHSANYGFDFSHDGKKMFMGGYADNFGNDPDIDKPIVEFDLSTPWNPGTATLVKGYDGESFAVGSGLNNNQAAKHFQFNYDGTKFYSMHGFSTNNVTYLVEGSLTRPYDLGTYSYTTHVDVSALINISTGIGSFSIAQDGKAVILYYSTNGSFATPTYARGYRCKMTSAWNISSLGAVGFTSSYQATGSLVGSEANGYYHYHISSIANTSYDDIILSAYSGNLSDQQNENSEFPMDDIAAGQSTNNILGNVYGARLIIRDNGTKFYFFIPQTSTVMYYTGGFGHIADRYDIDVSSLNLTTEPKDIRFTVNPTFTSMGSLTAGTSTDLYKEYDTSEASIDAEALRFKIEGDTDAEVTKFNVDLFT